MLSEGFAIVVDIGKTLGKVSLWTRDGRCLEKVTRANHARAGSLDAEGIADWLIEALAGFAGHPVEAIVPVAHGAAVAGIRDGAPAFAPPDYEAEIPAVTLADYRAGRDPFALTGSPALPAGLNLGCHSDLWNPAAGEFSSMARRRSWAARFAPLARAGDTIGTLRPELAARTGLPRDVRILAGLHDSNAALLAARGFAEIADTEATVLSTGTWFVAMRTPHGPVDLTALPGGRDCLVNVDPFGTPIPSARFMGGREIESVIGIDARRVDIKPDQPALLAAVPGLLASGAMLLPTLAPGFGPFPDATSRWIARPEDWHARRSAACLYAALVADTSLDLIGSRERLLVEGRFAEAEVFVRALAALRPDTAVYVANAHNDVSFGALRLLAPSLRPAGKLTRVAPLDDDVAAYRQAWRAALEPTESARG
jgi:sugar (pentulose or hexulose) kinase